MNIIGLKYNVTDNSYAKDLKTDEMQCISPKTSDNTDYKGPIEEEINTTFIIISNPYTIPAYVRGVVKVINVVSTNTGNQYRVMFYIKNIINPNIIQYRAPNNPIILLEEMEDGDIAEVITWHDANYPIGTIIQRYNKSIIAIHKHCAVSYPRLLIGDDIVENKVRILSKGTIIMI